MTNRTLHLRVNTALALNNITNGCNRSSTVGYALWVANDILNEASEGELMISMVTADNFIAPTRTVNIPIETVDTGEHRGWLHFTYAFLDHARTSLEVVAHAYFGS